MSNKNKYRALTGATGDVRGLSARADRACETWQAKFLKPALWIVTLILIAAASAPHPLAAYAPPLAFAEESTVAVETGEEIQYGDIVYAMLTVGGRVLPLYRSETPDGKVDCCDRKGRSVRRALMRSPIEGARVSSNFGMRRHPILGFSRMHTGTDFAAPTGTPIYAAGDGVIESVGSNGGYGKYIRIRHNSTYKTAYAHMSRFATGLRRGNRISQGQIIGFIGTTGRSTGPHLHYEVIRNGDKIDPQSLDLPRGEILGDNNIVVFLQYRDDLNRRFGLMVANTEFAQVPASVELPGRRAKARFSMVSVVPS